jgi:MFS family permease
MAGVNGTRRVLARLHDLAQRVEAPLASATGGPARLKVIVLLACVLALDAADKATVGAVALQLKQAMHIDDVQVGLLVSVSTATGALFTLPFGILADRVKRTRVLVAAMLAWSLAMLASGCASSYAMLMLSRLALGCIVAAASPIVVSLTGDFFRPGERGRVFSYVLAGELFGVAVGFLLSGNVAAFTSWRAAFWLLALVGFGLAWLIWRKLPEPARGGRSYVPEGAREIPMDAATQPGLRAHADNAHDDDPIARQIERQHIAPHAGQVLHDDPARQSLWQAARHLLAVRSFRGLVIASALGYFYFTGLRTFALIYMRETFGLGQAVASTLSVGIGCGAIVGAVLAGRTGDRLIRRGMLTARIGLGGGFYLVAAGALAAGLLLGSLSLVAPLFFVAAMGLGGANPSIDAAKLDVVHSSLWGRAEGIRATVRFALSAASAPLFGYVAALFGQPRATLHAAGGHAGGLRAAMLVLLVSLLGAGLVLLLRTARTYPRDVATTLASERSTPSDQAR